MEYDQLKMLQSLKPSARAASIIDCSYCVQTVSYPFLKIINCCFFIIIVIVFIIVSNIINVVIAVIIIIIVVVVVVSLKFRT